MQNKKYLLGIVTGVTIFSLFSFEEKLADDLLSDSIESTSNSGDMSINGDLPVGTIKELKNITQKNLGSSPYSKNNDWSTYDKVHTGLDSEGNILVAVEDEQQKSVFLSTYEKETYTLLTTVKLDHSTMPLFGDIYFAEDGYLYMMVGQDNAEFNDNKCVIEVRKYTYEGELQGTAEVYGKEEIAVPFICANSALGMDGDKLLVLTAAEMYNGHQANRWFYVDTNTMMATTTEWHQSHSFNQFLQYNDGAPVFLDHGDTYQRGIILVEDIDNQKKQTVFQTFDGSGNKTNATLNGFELSKDSYLVQGTMGAQSTQPINGISSTNKKNAFLIAADKNNLSPVFTWLTTYDDSHTNVVGEGRLVDIGNDQYVYLFSEYENEDEKNPLFKYHLLDSKGAILSSKQIQNMNFTGNSDPVVHENNITWVSPDSSNGETTYLYQLDISDPENPVVSGAVTDDSKDNFIVNDATNTSNGSGESTQNQSNDATNSVSAEVSANETNSSFKKPFKKLSKKGSRDDSCVSSKED